MIGESSREFAAVWTSPGKGECEVRLVERVRTPSARRLRALRTMALAVLGAAVAVFIPVLHFLLVPALLIGGVAAAVMQWRAGRQIRQAAGACPACAVQVSRELGVAPAPELWTLCPACGERLRIDLGAEA